MKKYDIPEIKITGSIALDDSICTLLDGSTTWEWADVPSLKEDN